MLANSSCNEFDSSGLSGTCFTWGALAVHSGTDYIETEGDHAWLVQGSKRTPFGSEAMSADFTNFKAKYPATRAGSPRFLQEKRAAWAAFIGNGDSDMVSPSSLELFSKKSGLNIRPRDGRTDTPKIGPHDRQDRNQAIRQKEPIVR
jgi:hypothetical protein